MASFTDSVKIVIDIVTDKAGSALSGLRTKVDEAEGSFGKLKAAGGGAFDLLKSAAPLALAGAGTAIAGFAVKAIGQFQDLALEVDNFVQKTGTTAAAASRWVEVSNDLGVSADATATAFGKFERQDAAGALNKYGLTATDTSGRFAELLGKIGAIPDQNEKAAAAFKVFGKSWQELAPLLDSTENLNDRLKEVGKGQIISDKQIASAREFRDMMDNLNDRLKAITVTAGSGLVGAIDELAATLGPVVDGLDTVTSAVGGLGTVGNTVVDVMKDRFQSMIDPVHDLSLGFVDATDAIGVVGAAVDGLSTGFGLWGDSSDGATKKLDDLIPVIDGAAAGAAQFALHNDDLVASQAKVTAATAEQQAAVDKLNKAMTAQADAVKAAYDANFALKDAQDKLSTSLATLDQVTNDATKSDGEKAAASRDAEKAAEGVAVALAEQTTAQQEANGAVVDGAQKQANFVQGLLATASTMAEGSPIRQNLLNLADAINNKLPAEKRVDVNVHADDTELQAAKLIYDALRDKTVNVTIKAPQGGGLAMKAAGGPVEAGHAYIVGENHPEVFVPNENGRIIPSVSAALSTSAMSPSGVRGDVHVHYTVNMNGTFLGSKSELGHAVNNALMAIARSGNRMAWQEVR